MANLNGIDRARYVHDMFERIAPHYDLMNHIMTFGQDVRWRRAVIERASLPQRGRMLDLGAGTGDLARLALQRRPTLISIGVDFTLEMMRQGIARIGSDPAGRLVWSGADVARLPFPDQSFDAVVSGFLFRNLADLPGALAEQFRVLKPAGRLVAMDTTPPSPSPLKPMIEFHLHTIIPALGRLIAGQAEAYHYLPDSTESFLQPERLAACLLAAGFCDVGFERRMFGTIAIHWAIKPGA